jgi:hypothetical protein
MRPGSCWQAQPKLHQQILPDQRSAHNVSPLRHANFTIRNMTRHARRFIEHPIMSVFTVKRTLRKRTPDTMLNTTGRRQYRRSLVLRSFRQLSRSYFASEKSWEFVIEALLFAIIIAISAWPVFAAVDALNQFLQRTAS